MATKPRKAGGTASNMRSTPHSIEFLVVRDAILGLEDAERARLAAIVEAAVPLAGRTERLCTVLAAITRLGAGDQLRLTR